MRYTEAAYLVNPVLLGAACITLVIMTIGLCACLQGSKTNEEGSKSKKKQKKSSKLRSKRAEKQQIGSLTDVDVEVGINGGVSTANGDRPKSHDRALPDIPGTDADRPAEDDDDTDTDGLYDVISKKPKKHSRANGSVKPKTATDAAQDPAPGQNPYELMPGELDSDSTPIGSAEGSVTYAAPTKVKTGKDKRGSDPPYSGIKDVGNVVGAVGGEVEDSVVYAAPKKAKNPYETVRDVGKPPLHDASSMDTLNTSLSSLPPVPFKNFDGDGESTITASPGLSRIGLTAGVSMTTDIPSGMPLATGLPGNLPIASASTSSPPPNLTTVTMATQPGVGLVTMGPLVTNSAFHSNSVTTSGNTGPVKREPPYSKVTARESLGNIRLRHAARNGNHGNTPTLVIAPSNATSTATDVDYDQINYDQIKSPGANGEPSSGGTGDTGSELYAEIGGSEPPSSTRSSMYAAVGDLISDSHAPTPPPVDSLKQITDIGGIDPGYSRIGGTERSRPHSTISGSVVVPDSTTEGATGIPLYAEVDKSKKTKNRHTVDSVNLEKLYAKVNKDRSGIQGGARPKVRQESNEVKLGSTEVSPGSSAIQTSGTVTNSHGPISLTNGVNSSGNLADPGYSTVEATVTTRKSTRRVNSDYYEVVDDDTSDIVQDSSEIGSEYDPNYESVGNIARTRLSVAKDSAEAGVAREIIPGGGGAAIDGENDLGMVHVSYNDKETASVWDKPGLIREHIYQEINDTKRNSKRKSKEQKEQKKSARHSRKDSGGSSKKL